MLKVVKILQYNSVEDFINSEEYKKMLAENEYFDVISYKDYVDIRIWKEVK